MTHARSALSAFLLFLFALAAATGAATPVRPVLATGEQGEIKAVAWSPDGRVIAAGGDDGVVRLWDIATGIPLRILAPGGSAIWGLAFSKDGRTLVSWDSGKAVFWDIATGRPRQTLALPDDADVIALTPDAPRLVVFADWTWDPAGHGSGIVAALDRRTGRPLRSFPVHNVEGGAIGSGVLSPDGRTVALKPQESMNGGNRHVRLWDMATGMQTRILTATGEDPVLSWSPDGRRLAGACQDGSVDLWDAATGRLLRTGRGPAAQVSAVTWSPDGKTVALALAQQSADEPYWLWDTGTGVLILPPQPRGRSVESASGGPMAFSPSGAALAWTEGGHLHVMDVLKLGPFTRVQARWTSGDALSAARGVSFSADGKRLLENQADGTVLVWDLHSGQPRRGLSVPGRQTVQAAWSRDGRHIITGAQGQDVIQFWDAATGQPGKAYWGGMYDMNAFAERPGGTVMAASSIMGVTDWHGASGSPSQLDVGDDGAFGALAWSPDGRALAVGIDTASGNSFVWDWVARRKRCDLALPATEPSDGVTALAFRPDGRFLAGSRTSSVAADIRPTWASVWDAATGKCRWTKASRAASGPVAWTPDGGTLVGGGGDGRIHLWDGATGRERRVLGDGTAVIAGVSVSPDGRTIAGAGVDGVVHLWERATGAELCRLVGLPAGEWLAYRPDGRFDGSARGRTLLRWVAGGRILGGSAIQRRYLRPGLVASALGFARPAGVVSRPARISSPDADVSVPVPFVTPPAASVPVPPVTPAPAAPVPKPAVTITPETFAGLKVEFGGGLPPFNSEDWKIEGGTFTFHGIHGLGLRDGLDVTLAHSFSASEQADLLTQLNAADVASIGGHYADRRVFDAGTTTLTLTLRDSGGGTKTVECSCYAGWSAAPPGFATILDYLTALCERLFAGDPEYRLFHPAKVAAAPSIPDTQKTTGGEISDLFTARWHDPSRVPRVTPAETCAAGYAAKVAPVPPDLAAEVAADYGLADAAPGSYVIDRLVPLDLGGSNAPSNLWPLTVKGPWNAAAKSRLDAALHALVCAGKLRQSDAIRAITTDWIAAYHKYVGGDPAPDAALPPTVPAADPARLLVGRTIAGLTWASNAPTAPLVQPVKVTFADGSALWVDSLTQPLSPDAVGRTITRVQDAAYGLVFTLSDGRNLTLFTSRPTTRLLLRDAHGGLVLVE